MEQLSDRQLTSFDTEYVTDARWSPIKRCIDRDFPDGRFTFLDVGGGNGVFADRILANYPEASGVVLDNSRLLLGRNRPGARKRTLLDTAESLARAGGERYDVVFFNWLLHHLVERSSYRDTRARIDQVLRSAAGVLTERGRVSVYENLYDGLFADGAPGWVVYQLTSARRIAKLMSRAGANTAGVGVCFQSRRQWCSAMARNGFQILDFAQDVAWTIPWQWKAFLHVGQISCGHFWLKPERPRPTGMDGEQLLAERAG